MAYTIETLQSDIHALNKNLGATLSGADRADVLDQLRELARQIKVIQMHIASMAGDRQPITAPPDRRPLGKAVREDKVVLLRKAVETLLGPNGGQRVPYSKTLAVQLLAKGLITEGQHKLWKACGHLPESVDLKQGVVESFSAARPV